MAKVKLLFRNRSMEAGGIENTLITILHYLDKSKFDITLLVNYKQGDFIQKIPNGIKVVYLAKGIEDFSKVKLIYLFQKSIRRIKFFFFQKNQKPFFVRNKLMGFDFEIAFNKSTMDDVYKSPNKSAKKVFWFHGNLPDFDDTAEEKKELVELMLKFDKGVFVSSYAKEAIEKNWHTHLTNSIVIHNPINTEEVLLQANEKDLGDFPSIDFISIGRLSPSKGYTDLINVHARLINEGFDIKTAIVGDGHYKEHLLELIKNKKVEKSFFLLGYKPNPVKYLPKSKIFVLPTYTESYPLVIAEALILGLPVVATNVGGIPEMMQNNVNGLLIEPGEENLYHSLKKILEKPDMLENFKENNKSAQKSFSLSTQMNKIENIFLH